MTSHPVHAEDPYAGAGGIDLWDVDQAYLEEWANLIPVEDGEPVLDDCAFTDEDALAGRVRCRCGTCRCWTRSTRARWTGSGGSRSCSGRTRWMGEGGAEDARDRGDRGERFCGDSMADRAVTMEVALALRIGKVPAVGDRGRAESAHRLPRFLDALSRGQISEWHARELVTGTRHVTDPDVIAALQDRLLPKAKRKTPAQFRTEVRKAVADLDAGEGRRTPRFRRADRYVTYRPLGDGMAFWVWWRTSRRCSRCSRRSTPTRRSSTRPGRRRRGACGDDDAAMDACRADALTARSWDGGRGRHRPGTAATSRSPSPW